MLREVATAVALAAALIAIVPLAPALPDPACGAASSVERVAQNDANSGYDAPDARASAFRVPVDGYYWGWLSPADTGRADRSDWYSFVVPPGTDVFMTNVTANYTLLYVQTFFLTLHPPTGPTETIDSTGGTITLVDPAPGTYDIEITASLLVDDGACASELGDVPDVGDTDKVQNHGLYVGCNPICMVDAVEAT